MCPNDRLSVACCIRVPDQWILAESLRISVLFDRETYNNRMSIVMYAESLRPRPRAGGSGSRMLAARGRIARRRRRHKCCSPDIAFLSQRIAEDYKQSSGRPYGTPTNTLKRSIGRDRAVRSALPFMAEIL
jgi:hypothetical protein